MWPFVAPESFTAFARRVSNTGWSSVGEDAITRRTSPVAVCCSNASVRSRFRTCSSWNNRTFSIAMTAWSAKILRSAICFSVKGRTSVRRITMAPIGSPLHSSGVARKGRMPRGIPTGLVYGNSSPARVMSWASVVSRWMTARPLTNCRLMGRVWLVGSEPYEAASRRMSPSTCKICASVASHSRAAFWATVSNTGWRFVEEPAITRRISPVAVCCSVAPVSSRLQDSSCSETRRNSSLSWLSSSARGLFFFFVTLSRAILDIPNPIPPLRRRVRKKLSFFDVFRFERLEHFEQLEQAAYQPPCVLDRSALSSLWLGSLSDHELQCQPCQRSRYFSCSNNSLINVVLGHRQLKT